MTGDAPWPEEIRISRSARTLSVAFDNGEMAELPAEYLRVESPSAEVQGHGGRRVTVGGKRHVGLIGAEPVGSYAVRLLFDDGHDTGLYSWRYLYRLAQEQDSRWQAYEQALADQGLSREG